MSTSVRIFLGGCLLVLLVVTIIALERVSPARKRGRRQIRRGHGDQTGELID